jgi:hypothetical protein
LIMVAVWWRALLGWIFYGIVIFPLEL